MALVGNYPGQLGNVGRPVGDGTLRYVARGLPPDTPVYAVVGPSVVSAGQSLRVDVGGGNHSTLRVPNSTQKFWLPARTSEAGELAVAISAVTKPTAGRPTALSGLWVAAVVLGVER